MNDNANGLPTIDPNLEVVEHTWIEKWVMNDKVLVTDGTHSMWPGIVVGHTADNTGFLVKYIPFYKGFVKIYNSENIVDMNQENYNKYREFLNKSDKKKYKNAYKSCLRSAIYTKEQLLKHFNPQKVRFYSHTYLIIF